MTTHLERDERLREEFYEEKCHYEDGDNFEVYENNPEDIADWWLSKLSSELQKREEEWREAIKSLKMEEAPPFLADDTNRTLVASVNEYLMPAIKEKLLAVFSTPEEDITS